MLYILHIVGNISNVTSVNSTRAEISVEISTRKQTIAVVGKSYLHQKAAFSSIIPRALACNTHIALEIGWNFVGVDS